jgi:acyl carrier protein
MASVRDVFIALVAEELDLDAEQVTDDATLEDDLGIDSLDQVSLVMALEERFGIKVPDDDAAEWTTVGQVLAWLEANGATVMPEPQGGW